MTRICALLMTKNEADVIEKTLDTLVNLDQIFVYDTGSTDNTIELAKGKPNVIVEQGEFIDFATSRNSMIECADKKCTADYYLLVDANDELRGNDLKKEIGKDPGKSCYMIKQIWKTRDHTNSYFNLRIIKAKANMKYKGKVHEYIDVPVGSTRGIIGDSHLYQDRCKNCQESPKRWKKDLEILKEEVQNNPSDTRSTYYLAQTYDCLNMNTEAFNAYLHRSTMGGYIEERWQSLYKCGDLAPTWVERLYYYLKAYQLKARVEPLLKITSHYRDTKDFHTAYEFVRLACKLNYPHDCYLFVDKDAYEYKRWHLMGIVAFYANHFKEGKTAATIAASVKPNPIDAKNITFYMEQMND